MRTLLLSLSLCLFPLMATSAPPEAGEAAPDFKFVDGDGKTYSLADERGKRGIVIAWFPKPFTPG